MKKFLLAIPILAAAAFVQAQTIDTSFRTYLQAIPSSSFQSKMIAIPAGTFQMGSSDSDKLKEADETPQRQVKVDAFWIGAYEVTYDEFNAFFLDESISQNTAVDAVTKAVVAICVEKSPAAGVGAVGVPVNAGEAIVALKAISAMF